MRVFTCLLLLFCLTSVPRNDTAADNLRVQDKSQDFWFLQARLISDDILKEASELSPMDRALLLGRLSAVWWRHDVEYARAALQKAMGEIEPGSDDESTSQRRKRISVIRTLLTIAAPLDERAGSRLVALLTSEDSKHSPEEATDNATGLVKAALIVLDTDPARAAALGSASLRVGKSWSFASLLSKLRRRDRALGDALFNEALTTAATRPDRDLLASLTLIAFNGPPADDLRRKLVLTISHQFLGSSSQDENTCSLAPVVAPLLEQFDRLLPQPAATVRAGLIRCQKSQLSSLDPAVARILDNEPLKTVDDLLDAASRASSTKDKVTHLSRAVYHAAQERNFERAVTILDSFTEDERKELGETWDNWRWDFASSAAIARLEKDDRHGMDKIINSTPVNLRAFVQIAVAEHVAKDGDTNAAVELLEAGRKGLLKLDGPNVADWYLSLLRRYAKLAPKEAPQVLREFVTVNNRKPPRVSSTSQTEKGTSYDTLQPLDLPVVLLQTDLMAIKEASSSLQPLTMRVRAHLGILKSLLELGRADSNAPISK